jgi:hypothetical protein
LPGQEERTIEEFREMKMHFSLDHGLKHRETLLMWVAQICRSLGLLSLSVCTSNENHLLCEQKKSLDRTEECAGFHGSFNDPKSGSAGISSARDVSSS